MAPRLVNTAPGEVATSVKPGQTVHMGLRSEALSAQIATLQLKLGLSNFGHHNIVPESDSVLSNIGVSVAFETSERRRPITGQATRSTAAPGNPLDITRTTGLLTETGIYEMTIPITADSPVLGYFKFEKDGWSTLAPDWCTATDLTGLYFGVEHGSFNTAAYLFPRDFGTGSFIFGGPLPAYNTVRPAQAEIAQDLDPITPGTQGWTTLPLGTPIELFIYFNTYTSPFSVEIWTRIPGQAGPILQTSVPLGTLGTFPNTIFTNSRTGPSDVARIFFGVLGNIGDQLRMLDWALFPDFRLSVQNGQALANASMIVSPDAPVQYSCRTSKLPETVSVGRWFPVTGPSYLSPAPSLFFQPGTYLTPRHLSLPKSGSGQMLYKRAEPRMEGLQDGFMVEAFLSGTSTSRFGDLVGPGIVLEDGQKSYKLMMLETPSLKNYGIASSDLTFDQASTYYMPATATDWSASRLVRMTVDRRRSRVLVHLDENKVIDLPVSSHAEIFSGIQTIPTTALVATTLSIDISTDGGATWPTTQSHTFAANPVSMAALVADMMGDVLFTGAGPTQIEVIDRGPTFSIRTVQTGALMGIRINVASTATGVGKLNLTIPSATLGGQSVFPTAPDTIGKVMFGHPYFADYSAELKLDFLSYLPRYLAWETEDSLAPDSVAVDTGVRFTLNSVGAGSEGTDSTGVTIIKSDFSSNLDYRYYKKTQTFPNVGGIQVDFGVQLVEYTDHLGMVSASNTATDAGIVLFLGDKKLFLGFYDCGTMGRKIAILPGSGDENDIINQTTLGSKFSANVDWSVFNRYRLVIKAFDSIKVWAGTVVQDPLITIPWRNAVDGFDLPLDVTAPAIAFGAFNFHAQPTSSTTVWKYVRWGYSNGYDVAVQQQFPNGYPKYLFGGREFVISEFDEA